MSLEDQRFVDSGKPLGSYADRVFAVCPTCAGPALVQSRSRYIIPFRPYEARVHCLRCSFLREENARWSGPVIGRARQVCPYCGYKWLHVSECRSELNERQRQTAEVGCPGCHRTHELPLTWYRDPFPGHAIDPTFGLPLWLQTPCCGHTLWAYNGGHLATLRDYVAATHRERRTNGKWSMITRLPQWIKSTKNRDEVLRCTQRLDERLQKTLGV